MKCEGLCICAYAGLPLVFSKYFPGYQISSRIFKGMLFGSIFSLKLSLKTMLNSVKTLKRYCKATLHALKKQFNYILQKILSTC